MRILVVDDEVDLAEAVATGLRREGYAVDVACSGADAIERAKVQPYDLVCLDLTMPDVDGLEVCAALRDDPSIGSSARILMLTARDAVEDRIIGLDSGADDYLVKPFAFEELLARVNALIRRKYTIGSSMVDVGNLRIDLQAKEVRRRDQPIVLTARVLGYGPK